MNRDLLYEKAFRMKAAQPWKTLAAEQVFAFEIAERIYYVQMTEDVDTDKILRIYQDENDLKSCLAMLEQAGVVPGMKFKYVFDFGDDWTFQCRVLKELDEITAHPRVIRSKEEPLEQYPDWEDEDDDEDEDW